MIAKVAPPRLHSLRNRLLLALLAYVVLLSLVVIAQGNLVHERAERLVWRAMLNSEFDHAIERMRDAMAGAECAPSQIVLSGGAAAELAAHLPIAATIRENLVLDGLLLIARSS